MYRKLAVLAAAVLAVVVALLVPATGGSRVVGEPTLRLAGLSPALLVSHRAALTTQALLAFPGVHIAPGVSPGGYIPLDALGVAPMSIGDEQIINLDVSPFLFNGSTHTRIGSIRTAT